MLLSCKKDLSDYNINNLNNNDIMIFGHAGMGSMYKHPGDTYESVIPVLGIGADGCEIDVQMTKDSILVMFHDDDMKLTTTCECNIYDYYWSELGGCKFHALAHNIYVITVDNLFSRISELTKYHFSFDCKLNKNVPYEDLSAYYKKFLRAIQRLCEKYNMTDNVFIEGNINYLKYASEVGLQNKLFISGTGNMDESIRNAKEINSFGIGISNYVTTADDINRAHAEGFWVMMWGGKTRAENKELISKSPDIIQTDKPIPLLKMFDRFNSSYRIP